MSGFSIGLGPIPWVINAEVFPKEAKVVTSVKINDIVRALYNKKTKTLHDPHNQNLGASLCASFNWFCAFLVVRLYPSAVEVSSTS